MVACSVRTKEHRSREWKKLLTPGLHARRRKDRAPARVKERADGDGRCVRSMFLESRRRSATLTLKPFTQRPPRTAPHSTPCSTRNCAPPRTSHNKRQQSTSKLRLRSDSESHGTGELRVRTTSSSRRGIGFTFTHQTSAQTETPSSIDGRRKCTGGSTTDGIQSESTHPIAHCMLLPAPTADAIAHSFILVLLVRHVGEDRSTPPGRCACLHRTWRPWR